MPRRKAKPAKRVEPPTFSCVLLCEDVTVSAATGKHNLSGVVSMMQTSGLPFTTGPSAAYIRLSNLYSADSVTLEFCHVETGEKAFSFEITASESGNPSQSHSSTDAVQKL